MTPEIARRMAASSNLAVNSPFKDSKARKDIDTLIAGAASYGRYWVDVDFASVNCLYPNDDVVNYYGGRGFHVDWTHDHNFSERKACLRISW